MKLPPLSFSSSTEYLEHRVFQRIEQGSGTGTRTTQVRMSSRRRCTYPAAVNCFLSEDSARRISNVFHTTLEARRLMKSARRQNRHQLKLIKLNLNKIPESFCWASAIHSSGIGWMRRISAIFTTKSRVQRVGSRTKELERLIEPLRKIRWAAAGYRMRMRLPPNRILCEIQLKLCRLPNGHYTKS